MSEFPECPAARTTFLLYNGKKLPAKHIRGIAYKVAYGKEISKNDYAGGMETVRFFTRLGYDMFYKGSLVSAAKNVANKTAKKDEKTVQQEKPIHRIEIKGEKSVQNKIKISSKEVIEQKNALQLLLNKYFDGDIVCEKTYSWLKIPKSIDGEYLPIYKALNELYGDTTFAKKNTFLRYDFVCESKKIIIEYDERQHFHKQGLLHCRHILKS